ncbi:hypothetical protein AB0I24_15475 [Brachybacterium paraconglomeratum]
MHQRESASRWVALTDDFAVRVTHLCDRRAGNASPCTEESVPDTVCFARAHELQEGTSVEQLNRIEERTAAAGGYGALIAIGIAPVMILVALGLAISGEVQEGASLALAAGVLGAVLIVHAVLAVTGAIARLLSSRLLGGDSILVSVASAERVAAQVRILDRQGVLEHGAGLEQILDVAYRALGAPRASESEISELLEAPVLDSAARRRFPAGR